MTVRDVEGKLPYTGGKAISIDENKVISLNLRDENNLIIYDEGDDEIYVDLQLPDGIRPLDAFPVGVTTGRVLVADDWDTTGTIVCFKTTSGDNIKLLYADDGKLYIDNGTGTFKQIYLKGEVDALLQALREYIDAQLALKQDKLTAGDNITIDANNVISASGGGDVKMFTLPATLTSAEALEVAQEALDWYFDGKDPVIRHENDFDIYICSGENQSGLLTPITYWLEFDNIRLAEGIVENANYRMPSSVVDSKIRFTYDETTHEVTLIEKIYAQQDFLPSNSSVEVVYNPSRNWDPTTKEYVDGKDVYIGASAPANPTQGRLWYDTTTEELKTYDGTNWNATGKEYTSGIGIQVGASHFDTQGPAPDGYHIPTDTEWQTLIGILTTTFSLASTGDTLKTYFKMPRAGYISTAGSINDVDTSGSYWSSTVGAGTYGRRVYCGAYNILFNGAYRSAGSSLRCFKDVSVIPNSSWTVLYDGSSMATGASVYDPGVYHNASLGLISASGDGVDWITIQDKNLGASVVYNSGDTLSEANSGGYFQRGNNYMFPFTGATTTSSTQVDGSGYGPGNYYSNSTFITGYDWSSVTNANLWGGETNGTRIDSKIYNTGVLSVNGAGGNVTVNPFSPENSGSTGYLLTKTSTGYNWANKLTLPTSTATAGYVLKKSASSASSYSWAAPDIGISAQSGNLLLTTAYLWIGTATDYQNLSSYDLNTIYITV